MFIIIFFVNNFIMKYIYIFFIGVFLLSIFTYNRLVDDFYYLFNKYNNVEYCYVVDNTKNKEIYSTMQSKINDCTFIKNGSKTLIRFKNSCKKFDFCAIEYFHAYFVGDKNTLNNIIYKINAKQVFYEKYKDKSIYFFYSNLFNKYKILKNKKVNFQFVLEENLITVGYPMIYISF